MIVLAVPTLTARLIEPSLALTDAWFVGGVGAESLAALAVASPFFLAASFLTAFLADGTLTLVGQARGRLDYPAAKRYTGAALLLALGLGSIVAGLLLGFADPLLTIAGAHPSIIEDAGTYLRVRAFGVPAFVLMMACTGVLHGHQDARSPLVAVIILSIANVGLDALLIVGLNRGLIGAAFATLTAQWCAALYLCSVLSRRHLIDSRWPIAELKRLLQVGVPLTLRTAALGLTMIVSMSAAARIGVAAVAAHLVAVQIWSLLTQVVEGLSVAAHILVARLRGAGETKEAQALGYTMMALALIVGLTLMATLLPLQGFIASSFTDSSSVHAALLSILPFVAWMQPVNSLVFTMDALLLAAERFTVLAIAMALAAIVACVLIISGVRIGGGLSSVWWGMVAFMILRGIIVAPRAIR